MTEKELQKLIKLHKESYLMYEKTKQECKERMSEALNPDGTNKWTEDDINEKLNLISMMQNDIKEKYLLAGGDINELTQEVPQNANTTPKKHKTLTKKNTTNTKSESKVKKPIITKTKKTTSDVQIESKENTTATTVVPIPLKTEHQEVSVVPSNWDINDLGDSFDVIPLPSKGECYDGDLSSIAVSYLTANDENMIVSPNLYRDGLILDYLLKAKIKNNINPDDLLEGDREAIILWLRATSYGTDYPISVTDNKTGVVFDTVVDLRQIKHKPFVLQSDGEGNFDYQLPVSKDKIKFRFLTHGDNKQIEEIEKEELSNVKKERLEYIINTIDSLLENETLLNKDEKLKVFDAKRSLRTWADKIVIDDEMGYTHKLTNRLELSIVSINGNEDRTYIANYVSNMNVRDALSLRRYINENEPGLDYSVMVERPESLGGGSMPVFLSVDEYVFLNIT